MTSILYESWGDLESDSDDDYAEMSNNIQQESKPIVNVWQQRMNMNNNNNKNDDDKNDDDSDDVCEKVPNTTGGDSVKSNIVVNNESNQKFITNNKKSIDFQSNTMSWSQLVKQNEEFNEEKTSQNVLIPLDMELDSSKAGLPLLFKTTKLLDANTITNTINNGDDGDDDNDEKVMLPKVDELDDMQEFSSLKREKMIIEDSQSKKRTRTELLEIMTNTNNEESNNNNNGEEKQEVIENKWKSNSILLGTPKHADKKQKTDNGTINKSIINIWEQRKQSLSTQQTVKDKPAPLSPKSRVKARAKQISLGKATPGYQSYIKQFPKGQRLPHHLSTPKPKQNCSKRSWDGQVKKWRRFLHEFD